MSATGDTPGLTTTSSPTATWVDGRADLLDDAGDVAPGHVRQRRLAACPRVTHRSMWLRALVTTRMRTSSAASGGGSISPHRYDAG